MTENLTTTPPSNRVKSARAGLTVLLASPRGFCAGVVRAIDAVRDALRVYGPPVYVRRPIVHNLEVVRMLEAEGAIFVEELDDVPNGAVVLFSAHGVAPAVAAEARRRGLIAYDAVCPLVAKVHREVERHYRNGRRVVLVGHEGHPEIAGTLGHLPRAGAFVINDPSQIPALPLRREEPVAYAVQTTYSVDDAALIVTALAAHFSDLVGPSSSDICYATSNRQAAVRSMAAQADTVIIVGECFSSNARRLAEVAAEYCPQVQLAASSDDINWRLIPPDGTLGISSAASTPERSVEDVIDALRQRYHLDIQDLAGPVEDTVFKRMPVI
jgi:4-hydroxy-3-methylbut-2-enyl diphosphate reductase